MRTTDNSEISFDDLKRNHPDESPNLDDLSLIANKKLGEISLDDYPNLLFFPKGKNVYHDDIQSSEIFSLTEENKLRTNNIMGFIGLNNTNLTIASRFAKDDGKDYFLHYMLHRVMKINVLELLHPGGKSEIWNFLIFFFPYFLNKALSQGLYKEYRHNEYNDANVRGVIDVKRHLRVNIPFSGKVAYSTREYSYDNPVTQIIRHTMEYIKTQEYNLLSGNTDAFININQIIHATSTYNINNRQKVISINRKKPVVHPYFTEYKALQRLCIRILCNEKISTSNEKEKIHGMLFDGAWLWEEYLNTILAEKGFEHPNNRTGEGRRLLFEGSTAIYPDFILKKIPVIIADAKYKHMEKHLNTEDEEKQNSYQRGNNSDYYQLITYMYRFNSKTGYLIFPYSGEKPLNRIEKIILQGLDNRPGDSKIVLLGLKIPDHRVINTFSDFHKAMKESEKALTQEM
jgi:5-methylcytosine-specific restriction endonuclease McrBC regulatory subunit McrC